MQQFYIFIQHHYCMSVEYVAVRITAEARDSIKSVALPKETMSEAIIRCCSEVQQQHNNDTRSLEERVQKLEEQILTIQQSFNATCMQDIERNPPSSEPMKESHNEQKHGTLEQASGQDSERITVTPELKHQLSTIIDFGLTAHNGSQKAFMQEIGITNANVLQHFKSGGSGGKTIAKKEYELLSQYGQINGVSKTHR